MAGCACSTSSGRVVLSRAPAGGPSSSSFSGPSHIFFPFARLVSGVRMRRNLGVHNHKIVYFDCSVACSGVLIGSQPLASACWQSEWSPSARRADSIELAISLQSNWGRSIYSRKCGLTDGIDDEELSAELGLDYC